MVSIMSITLIQDLRSDHVCKARMCHNICHASHEDLWPSVTAYSLLCLFTTTLYYSGRYSFGSLVDGWIPTWTWNTTTAISINLPLFVLGGLIITTEVTTTTTVIVIVSTAAISLNLPLLELGGLIMITTPTLTTTATVATTRIVETTTILMNLPLFVY